MRPVVYTELFITKAFRPTTGAWLDQANLAEAPLESAGNPNDDHKRRRQRWGRDLFATIVQSDLDSRQHSRIVTLFPPILTAIFAHRSRQVDCAQFRHRAGV